MQQLAGFLASISTYEDRAGMLAGAAHRVAEALEAEVCAIVGPDDLLAVVGFPAARIPRDDLLAVADGDRDTLVVPGVGEVPATCIEVHVDVARAVVVGRSGDEPDRDERHLVRAMCQVLELTLELRGSADRERELREATERQAQQLREVNDQLVRAMAVKRDLVSMASHELRTPLMTMLGFSSVLREGWRDFSDDERDEYLGILDRHGRRLLRLVDDLLTVGQLEGDRVKVIPSRVPLSDTIAEILRTNGFEEVQLNGSVDDQVVVDTDHLTQMVMNLVENARKYGAEPIEVDVESSPTTASFTVCDNGTGVPDEFVPALFDRFTQASTGFRREGSGVGLGLAIVAGLASGNGGTVAYHRDGDRTCFTVRLPRAYPDGQDAAPR